MPGLRRSLGSADIGAKETTPSERLDSWSGEHKSVGKATANHTITHKVEHKNPRRFSYPVRPAVRNGFDELSSDDSSGSESSIHEGFENLRILPSNRSLLHPPGILDLPPTPPHLNNSDVAPAHVDSSDDSEPVSSDVPLDVSRYDRLSQDVVPGNDLSPSTPEISPPTSHESLPTLLTTKGIGKPDSLHPPTTLSPDLAQPLRQCASSHADSFKTAREDVTLSMKTTPAATPVGLPLQDESQVSDPSQTSPLGPDVSNSKAAVDGSRTPVASDSDCTNVTPIADDTVAQLESPTDTAGSFPDLEKHISYVIGPDELDDHQRLAPGQAPAMLQRPVHGLGLLPDGLPDETEPSAEDVNNLVYRHLQEQNVKRHSGISTNSGAITASVDVSGLDTTPKKLKRTTKCVSLRDGSSPPAIHAKHTLGGPRELTVRKTRARLEDSPSLHVASPRQVSLPARLGPLGPNASKIVALTMSSMQDAQPDANNILARPVKDTELQREKSRRVTSPGQSRSPEHALRHFSPSDRLYKNMSVRRSSLDASPKAEGNDADFRNPPDSQPVPLRASSVSGNIAVKRTAAVESQVRRKPRAFSASSSRTPHSIGMDAQAMSSVTDNDAQRPQSSRSLRRFSREERLENVHPIRRGYDFPSPTLGYGTVADMAKDSRQSNSEFAVKAPLAEDSNHVRSLSGSSDARIISPFSPWKSLTPLSTSQVSDHTDVSVHEANGVRLYPHNNDSIRELDLQQSSRPVSKGGVGETLPGLSDPSSDHASVPRQPVFAAQVDPPTPEIGSSMPSGHVDSPLTNPRAAPQPPTFKFIPPTPDQELLRESTGEDSPAGAPSEPSSPPQRRPSLLQRARKYSDLLLPRTGSLRKTRPVKYENNFDRPSLLSPMWKPEGFWDDIDSEDDYEYESIRTRLPAGGDTSELGVKNNAPNNKLSRLPRQMSKRLPGFRGNGGFLVGNSVGIDRHGTNNRRHYVSTSTRTLSKQESQELRQSLTTASDGRRDSAPAALSLAHNPRQKVVATRRGFIVPFTGGKRAHWIGAQRFRAHVHGLRQEREERLREKRRNELRGQIGMRLFHEGRA